MLLKVELVAQKAIGSSTDNSFSVEWPAAPAAAWHSTVQRMMQLQSVVVTVAAVLWLPTIACVKKRMVSMVFWRRGTSSHQIVSGRALFGGLVPSRTSEYCEPTEETALQDLRPLQLTWARK